MLAEKIARMERQDPERVIQLLEPLVVDRRRERLLEVIGKRLASIEVIFESPHDPHNGAAVIRSCEAFGVQKLNVVETREPFLASASVAKGSLKWVDIARHPNAASAIAAAEASGHELIATHPEGDLLPADLCKIPRFSLILGNERDGIGDALRAAAKRSVRVPMRGFVESLNVSVTASILLSHATEARPGDLPEADRRRLYARGLYLSVVRAEEIVPDPFGDPPTDPAADPSMKPGEKP
ncbi:MAG TPA: RNA methyltransferase [Polyangiaceae bacterium]